ncbi:MAG: histidine kinase, partial [Proteobacteria bacterium]
HNCRFLAGADTEPWLTEMLRNGIRRRQPVMVEILNYKRNGTPFRNAVMVAPIFDANGDLEYFLGSQVEIAEDVARANDARRKEAHDRVTALSRRQREVLLHMAAGKLNKQIAYELELSERTVKMHRAAVIGALGAKTSADAIRIAIEAGY